MTVTSGLRCSELYKSAGRLGCLQKMLLVTSRWVSTKCFLTWKEKTTPANRLLFQLVPKMPVTDGIGSGLWPTPMSRDWKGPQGRAYKGEAMDLPGIVKMWPTPRSRDWKMSGDVSNWKESKIGDECLRRAVGRQETTTGSLNPTWVEWLMGYPIGWTDLED